MENFMKHSLLFLIALMVGIFAQAQTISESQAKQYAADFFSQQQSVKPAHQRKAARPTLAYSAKSAQDTQPAIYIFNRTNEEGYVVVAGDERASHIILGYTDHGTFDSATVPENLSNWLQGYTDEIAWLRQNDNSKSKIQNPKFTATPVVGPLITTQWDQEEPYNTKTPKMSGEHTPVGCVAVAVAQIMNYHRWPNQGTGSVEYEWNNSYLECDFSESTYNWENLDIPQLMSDVGLACEMQYATWSSSAYDWDAGHALTTYFGYDKGMQLHFRSDYGTWDDQTWDDMVRAELDALRPVYYAGVMRKLRNSYGHAFVCDGYDDSDYFHFNFGWGGQGDGWYLTTAINPDEEDRGYNYQQSIITHIQKDAGNPLWLASVTSSEGLCSGHFWALQETTMEGTSCLEDVATGKKYYAQPMPFTIKAREVLEEGSFSFPEGNNDFTIEWADGHKDEYHHIDIPDGTYKKTRVFRIQGTEEWQPYDYNYGNQFGDELRETFVWVDVVLGEWTTSSSKTFTADNLEFKLINDSEIEVVDYIKDSDTIIVPGSASYRGETYTVAGIQLSSSSCLSITLPEGLRYIDYLQVPSVLSLTLPEGLRYIGNGDTNGIRFGGAELTLPSSLESINDYGLAYNENLASINIPASVKEIGTKAFSGCSALKTVTFEDGIGLSALPGSCFYGCKRLKNIVIPNSVKRIEECCFENCGSLKELDIPAFVQYIGPGAFSGCTNIEHINFAEDGVLETIEGGNYEYNDCFYGCENLEYISFPSSLKTFKTAFRNCGIRYADFSHTQITELSEDYTFFYGCHALESVLLPNTIKTIGSIFYNCEKMTSFIIPEGTETVSSIDATNMTSLTIPASVTELGSLTCDANAVIVCEGMTPPEGPALIKKSGLTIYVPTGAKETYAAYRSGYITGTIIEMADNSDVNIAVDGETATVLGSTNQASLVIPESVSGVPVAAIADYAFAGNGTLTSVDIPSSVASTSTRSQTRISKAVATSGIGDFAFSYCLNLDTIHVHWTTPLTINETVFQGLDLSEMVLIIPDGTILNYLNADIWNSFGTILEETAATGIQQPTIKGHDNQSDISSQQPLFDLQGRRIATPTSGIYIQGNRKILIP